MCEFLFENKVTLNNTRTQSMKCMIMFYTMYYIIENINETAKSHGRMSRKRIKYNLYSDECGLVAKESSTLKSMNKICIVKKIIEALD